MGLVEFRQKGKPTYMYDNFRVIFSRNPDENYHALCFKIIKKFGEEYHSDLRIGNIDYKGYDEWTELGTGGVAHIKLNGKYQIRFGWYRDGWHINLTDGRGGFNLKSDIKIALFDDVNRTSMWTQETEKVADMIGELYQALYFLGEVV